MVDNKPLKLGSIPATFIVVTLVAIAALLYFLTQEEPQGSDAVAPSASTEESTPAAAGEAASSGIKDSKPAEGIDESQRDGTATALGTDGQDGISTADDTGSTEENALVAPTAVEEAVGLSGDASEPPDGTMDATGRDVGVKPADDTGSTEENALVAPTAVEEAVGLSGDASEPPDGTMDATGRDVGVKPADDTGSTEENALVAPTAVEEAVGLSGDASEPPDGTMDATGRDVGVKPADDTGSTEENALVAPTAVEEAVGLSGDASEPPDGTMDATGRDVGVKPADDTVSTEENALAAPTAVEEAVGLSGDASEPPGGTMDATERDAGVKPADAGLSPDEMQAVELSSNEENLAGESNLRSDAEDQSAVSGVPTIAQPETGVDPCQEDPANPEHSGDATEGAVPCPGGIIAIGRDETEASAALEDQSEAQIDGETVNPISDGQVAETDTSTTEQIAGTGENAGQADLALDAAELTPDAVEQVAVSEEATIAQSEAQSGPADMPLATEVDPCADESVGVEHSSDATDDASTCPGGLVPPVRDGAEATVALQDQSEEEVAAEAAIAIAEKEAAETDTSTVEQTADAGGKVEEAVLVPDAVEQAVTSNGEGGAGSEPADTPMETEFDPCSNEPVDVEHSDDALSAATPCRDDAAVAGRDGSGATETHVESTDGETAAAGTDVLGVLAETSESTRAGVGTEGGSGSSVGEPTDVGEKSASAGQLDLQVETLKDGDVGSLNVVEPMPDAPVPPTFDLVRVDSFGTTVLAGRAPAGSLVEALVDGDVAGSQAVGRIGQFAMIFSVDTQRDTLAIGLRAILPDGRSVDSDNAVFVVVPQGRLAASEVVSEEGAELDSFAAIEAPNTEFANLANLQPSVLLATDKGVRLLQPSVPDEEGQLLVEIVSYDKEGEVFIAGSTMLDAGSIKIYLNGELVKSREISPGGSWWTDLVGVDPGRYVLRVDEVDSSGNSVNSVEMPFQKEAPEHARELLEIASFGKDADSNQAEQGPVISLLAVQRGFTLWGISRKQYGLGRLYVNIFNANRDQIENPHLIYPGQIFAIPDDSNLIDPLW